MHPQNHDIVNRLNIFGDALHDNDLPGEQICREAARIIEGQRLVIANMERDFQALTDDHGFMTPDHRDK